MEDGGKKKQSDFYDGYHCAKRCKFLHGNFMQWKII